MFSEWHLTVVCDWQTCGPRIPGRNETLEMLVFEEGRKTGVPGEKICWAICPHMMPSPGIDCRGDHGKKTGVKTFFSKKQENEWKTGSYIITIIGTFEKRAPESVTGECFSRALIGSGNSEYNLLCCLITLQWNENKIISNLGQVRKPNVQEGESRLLITQKPHNKKLTKVEFWNWNWPKPEMPSNDMS